MNSADLANAVADELVDNEAAETERYVKPCRCHRTRKIMMRGTPHAEDCIYHPDKIAALRALGEENKRLGWGVVRNAHRNGRGRAPRWAWVKDATGMGSTSAKALCRRHDADPDEVVEGTGGDMEDKSC